MRLVEVVMLMGAHCVSPVEHSQMMTEAAKVQCAVVIERDTESGAVSVTPREAAGDPQVAAAMSRFGAAPVDPLNDYVTRIVPAWAPAGSAPTETKPPLAKAIVPPPDLQPETATSAAASTVAVAPAPKTPTAVPPPERKVAALASPPQRPPQQARRIDVPAKKGPPAKTQKAAAAKPASQCKGSAMARWYTTADGKKKFRCVRPGSAPAQLY